MCAPGRAPAAGARWDRAPDHPEHVAAAAVPLHPSGSRGESENPGRGRGYGGCTGINRLSRFASGRSQPLVFAALYSSSTSSSCSFMPLGATATALVCHSMALSMFPLTK